MIRSILSEMMLRATVVHIWSTGGEIAICTSHSTTFENLGCHPVASLCMLLHPSTSRLQLRLGLTRDQSPSMLQTLPRLLDHIIDNNLCGLDVLSISSMIDLTSPHIAGLTWIMALTSPISQDLPDKDFSGCFSSSTSCGILPLLVRSRLMSASTPEQSLECAHISSWRLFHDLT